MLLIYGTYKRNESLFIWTQLIGAEDRRGASCRGVRCLQENMADTTKLINQSDYNSTNELKLWGYWKM